MIDLPTKTTLNPAGKKEPTEVNNKYYSSCLMSTKIDCMVNFLYPLILKGRIRIDEENHKTLRNSMKH
jgi:hypothetical protein